MTDNPYETPEAGSEFPAAKKGSLKRTVAWLIFAVIAFGLVVALLLPAMRWGREPARRMMCSNNLRAIAIALLAYEAEYGCLPSAHTLDAEGRPLHSWRTLILPYLEHEGLYDKVDLSKPWDHPANREARKTHISFYQCPSTDVPDAFTTYMVVLAERSCLQPDEPRKLSEIRDGPTYTLLVVELSSSRAVHWMSPSDTDEATLLRVLQSRDSAHGSVFNVAFADGSVQRLVVDLDPKTLHALITADGGDQDVIDEDAL